LLEFSKKVLFNLFGFVEYVTEEVFNHLKEDLKHWSLFKYRDDDLEWHYCIIYGTVSLLNHDTFSTAKFQMLNGEFEAKETTLRVGYYYLMYCQLTQFHDVASTSILYHLHVDFSCAYLNYHNLHPTLAYKF